MLFGQDKHFYNASIRRYIALFGSLFTDMVIKRKGENGREDIVKVPIKYGNQSVYLTVAQDMSRETTKVSRVLPAMAFELTNIYKDVERKTNPMNRLQSPTSKDGKSNWQYNRIPYNFLFSLYIKTKNIEDALQIVEQIIPAFDGNLSVTIQDIPDAGMDIEQDVKIKIEEIEMEDNYQDEMKGREIDYTITFELSGYLYKSTQSSYVVREVDIYTGFDYGATQTPLTLVQHTEVADKNTNDNLSSMDKVIDSLFDSTPKVQPSRKKASRKKE